jgi:outer membrane protein assembly factor BamE (lipoprotein component of BamABCDE complex)
MRPTLRTLALLLAIAAGSSGCLPHIVHQGNVLEPKKVNQVQVGDTRFSVETLLGTPVMHDVLHPNRATYIEEYRDPESGKHYTRGITITYDEALRVTAIRKFGFDQGGGAH